jgi:hypothetical protein
MYSFGSQNWRANSFQRHTDSHVQVSHHTEALLLLVFKIPSHP